MMREKYHYISKENFKDRYRISKDKMKIGDLAYYKPSEGRIKLPLLLIFTIVDIDQLDFINTRGGYTKVVKKVIVEDIKL